MDSSSLGNPPGPLGDNPKAEIKDSRLKTTTLSTAYNIALQIGLRIFTFVVNAFILRYITKETLGIINVRLLLLYTTIQFITREPVRRTCAPNNEDQASKSLLAITDQYISTVNVTFLTVPLSFITGLVFSLIWYNCFDRPPENVLVQYQYAILSIYVSVIIESLAEACFIYCQRFDFIRVKVFIEGLFQTTRCFLLAFFVYLSPDQAILGFAIAQIIASILYCLAYYAYFVGYKRVTLEAFLPAYIRDDNYSPTEFDTKLISTWAVFLVNSTLKQFLTEGERYIMTVFSVMRLAEQGVFDVVNNLGSLPARLIFQQIEENAFLLFSGLVNREIPAEKQRNNITKSLKICCNLVKMMFLLGLTLFVYGYNCASLVLFLYGGSNFLSGKYGEMAIELFQWHCIYIVFIAVNGILEAYTFAGMPRNDLINFNKKMVNMSAGFIISSLLLTSYLGSVGFIVANCLNMITRIVISLRFIKTILSPDHSLRQFLQRSQPSTNTLISYAIVFVFLTIFKKSIFENAFELRRILAFVGVNGFVLLLHLVWIYRHEYELVDFVKQKIFRSRSLKLKAN